MWKAKMCSELVLQRVEEMCGFGWYILIECRPFVKFLSLLVANEHIF